MFYLQATASRIREFNFLKRFLVKNRIEYDMFTGLKDLPALRMGDVVDASLPVMRRIFDQRFATLEELAKFNTYHRSVMKYAGRNITGIDYNYLKKNGKKINFPVFIKPFTAKAFEAGIVSDCEEAVRLVENADISKHTLRTPYGKISPYFISEVVRFVSEWRGYVIAGKCLLTCNYDGDENVTPDGNVIDGIADSFYRATGIVAFCVDVGVLDDGRTVLVELNDGYSIGWYSDDESKSSIYADMIVMRYKQIMGE